MKTNLNVSKALLPLTVVATLLLGLTACQPQEIPLFFETLEQKNNTDSTKQWGDKEPELIVMVSEQDIEEAKPFVMAEALATLQQMDFTTHFAVLAFRGLQGNSHAGFKIERIARQGNEIALYAQPGREGPENVETSPYHLVEVKKDRDWNEDFTFKLYFDQESRAVTSTTHHVP